MQLVSTRMLWFRLVILVVAAGLLSGCTRTLPAESTATPPAALTLSRAPTLAVTQTPSPTKTALPPSPTAINSPTPSPTPVPVNLNAYLVDQAGYEPQLDVNSGKMGQDETAEAFQKALVPLLNKAAGGNYYPIQWISAPEILSDTPGLERYRVWAEFTLPDGRPLDVNGIRRFDFTLQRLSDGQLHLVNGLPGRRSESYAAYLPVAELKGLDETGVLRALVEEWLRKNESPYLPQPLLLLDYKIDQIEKNNRTGIYFLTYSVRPAQLAGSVWMAGDGVTKDGWVMRKSANIRAVQKGELFRLEIVSNG